jgi:hypothetical protein
MEIVVVSAILSVVSVAFLGTFATVSRFHEKNLRYIKAELIAEEGIEAIRLIKSGGFEKITALTPGGKYYFSLATSSWGVTTTPEVIDGMYYRSFTPYQVMRNASDDIVSTGGTIDPSTFRFQVRVDWNWRNATNTAIYESYMTNL